MIFRKSQSHCLRIALASDHCFCILPAPTADRLRLPSKHTIPQTTVLVKYRRFRGRNPETDGEQFAVASKRYSTFSENVGTFQWRTASERRCCPYGRIFLVCIRHGQILRPSESASLEDCALSFLPSGLTGRQERNVKQCEKPEVSGG